MNKAQAKLQVQEAIDAMKDELVELANKLHNNPETKFVEYKASKWLREAAERGGFEAQQPVGELDTAFKATFHGEAGPTIAFLSEYDALPGLGHACGHNLIGTASLGAAIGMVKGLDSIPGTIQLIGTPGEEGGGGKVILADAGVFDGVDVAMMFHPSGQTVLYKYALARRKLKIEFFGKAAHSAGCPEKGRNALEATLLTFASINSLRQHMISSSRIHGIITDGGKAPNIVPDYSASLFYVRAMDDNYCDDLLERVEDCAQSAAIATGTEVQMEMQGAYKTLITNMTLAETFKQNLEQLGWQFDNVPPDQSIGSTDMANVSHVVPAIHPYLSIGPEDLAGHSTEFAAAAASDKGHQAMITAAKAMAMTAVDILFRPSLLAKIRNEFIKA